MNYRGFILVFIGIAIVALAFWGWMDLLPQQYVGGGRVAQALFLAARVFTFGDVYDSALEWKQDWRLQYARWLGLLAAGYAILRLMLVVFDRQLRRLRAWGRRGHAVILGENALCWGFAAAWAASGHKATVHVRRGERVGHKALILERPDRLDAPLMRDSLKDVGRIIVAEADDATTAEVALTLASEFPDTPVFAAIEDPWLADRLTQSRATEKPVDLIVVSESVGAARAVISRHPPFVQAAHMNLAEVHVLIVGFGCFGEALAVEILANCLIAGGAVPRITVLAADAAKREKGFRARRGGLYETSEISARLTFIEGQAAELADIDALKAKLDANPPCAVYIAPDVPDEALAQAVGVRDLAMREALFSAPIFVRARAGAGLRPHGAGVVPDPCELVSFGSWDSVMTASGMLADRPDHLAKDWHEAYQNFMPSSQAAVPWTKLADEYRLSNRRAVAHLPAKLHSVGFDITPLTAWVPASAGGFPALASDEPLFRNAAELLLLAELEHDRWCMDRRLNGWRAGNDLTRRRHQDLVPFAEVRKETRHFDVRFIVWLQDRIKGHPDGLKRRPDAAPPADTAAARALVLKIAPNLKDRLGL